MERQEEAMANGSAPIKTVKWLDGCLVSDLTKYDKYCIIGWTIFYALILLGVISEVLRF